MKHTQGEWKWHGSKMRNEDDKIIHTTAFLQSDKYIEEADANAKLIAAAPELLEALLFMAVHLQGRTTVIMMSAIETATGMTYKEIRDYIKEEGIKKSELHEEMFGHTDFLKS